MLNEEHRKSATNIALSTIGPERIEPFIEGLAFFLDGDTQEDRERSQKNLAERRGESGGGLAWSRIERL
jgi:hypothetical protein